MSIIKQNLVVQGEEYHNILPPFLQPEEAVVENQVPSVLPPMLPAPPAQRVVVAPTTFGKSFRLRCSYGPLFSMGQMLVVMDKTHRRPMEVLGTLFPLSKRRMSETIVDRIYLGSLQIGPNEKVVVMEIRVPVVASDITYRVLWPSWDVWKDWQVLELDKLKIITTEDQRSMLTMFTGILYKTVEELRQQARANKPIRRDMRSVPGNAGNSRIRRVVVPDLGPLPPEPVLKYDLGLSFKPV